MWQEGGGSGGGIILAAKPAKRIQLRWVFSAQWLAQLPKDHDRPIAVSMAVTSDHRRPQTGRSDLDETCQRLPFIGCPANGGLEPRVSNDAQQMNVGFLQDRHAIVAHRCGFITEGA